MRMLAGGSDLRKVDGQLARPSGGILAGAPLLYLGLREEPDSPGEQTSRLQPGRPGQVRA